MYRSVIWFMETTRMLTNERQLFYLHVLADPCGTLNWGVTLEEATSTPRYSIIKDSNEDQVIP